MNYTAVTILSYSVFIGALIGWIRFNKIEPAFFYFVILIWIAAINEVLSTLLTIQAHSTAINNNVYVLFEAIFILLQFRAWKLFKDNRVAKLVLLIISIVWITDNLFLGNLVKISYGFRIASSILVVAMSIWMNNRLIFTWRKKLYKSPVFLICTGFILYFTYKLFTELLWIYGLHISRQFRVNAYIIMAWINLFVNLIYGIAILYIPWKTRHLQLYSSRPV